MVPACLIIAAHLCISREYLPVTQRSVAFQVTKRADDQAVRRLGIKIEIHLQESDDAKSPSDLLNKHCDGKSCIYYHKYCDLRLSECTYSSGERVAGNDGKKTLRLQRFIIAYHSLLDLLKAERRMYLAYGSKTKMSYVRLQVLQPSPSQFPPSCSTRDSGCEPDSRTDAQHALRRLSVPIPLAGREIHHWKT